MNTFPGDQDRVVRTSLIEEGREKQVRMAFLSVVGSHSTNGVAALHSRLLQQSMFKDFYELWPERFNNKTNGITQRRWLLKCNPGLADLATELVGDRWITNLEALTGLAAYADDAGVQERVREIKYENKVALANLVQREQGITLDPASIFDAHVKRLHEYKRQLLNVMHILHRYLAIKENPQHDYVPHTFIFAAKAAPGYAMAKLIIKLINDVAAIVNEDPLVSGVLKVVFLPDYRVSLAERIIPATDLSEQISTAGTEASGTGNMKFTLNGALTIGTLDGANIEIRQEVGEENFFLFGNTVEEVQAMQQAGSYNPWHFYHDDPDIRRVVDLVHSDFINLEQPDLYTPIWNALLRYGDRYFHLADFQSYVEAQTRVDAAYRDPSMWTRMCIHNIAQSGKFSSDRTISEYARDIWGITPCPITIENGG